MRQQSPSAAAYRLYDDLRSPGEKLVYEVDVPAPSGATYSVTLPENATGYTGEWCHSAARTPERTTSLGGSFISLPRH